MSIDNNTRRRKFLTCQAGATSSVTQNMDDANPTMAHYNLAFNRQFEHDLIILNVALNSHDRGNSFQFVNNRENGKIACMNDQFDPVEVPPDGIGQFFEVRNVGI